MTAMPSRHNGTSRRVVVIGAGIVGIACASYLQREGHEVLVLDPEPPGTQCSFGNAGGLSPGSCVPQALPGILRHVPRWLLDSEGPLVLRLSHLPHAIPWLLRFLAAARPRRVEEVSNALRALHRLTFDCYEPLVQDAGCADLIQRRGQIFLYETKASFAGAAHGLRLRRERGVQIEVLTPEELGQLEPAIARNYAYAVFLPEQGQCRDPYRLVKALAEHFVRQGGSIRQQRALDFELRPDGAHAVRTDHGEHSCDAIVVAAGAWSRALAAQLGSKVPLEAERGYHVTVHDPGVELRTQTMWTERAFVANPMLPGLRFAGTAEFAGLDKLPDMRRARVLLKFGKRMLPGLRTNEVSEWSGQRPATPDSLPVIGPSPHVPGVYYAFGHGHTGLIGASVTGRLIADLITGRPTAVNIKPYRVDRF